MSWGTDFTADLFLSHITVKTEDDAKEAIDELLADNHNITDQLKMMAIARPKDLLSQDDEDILITLSIRVDNLLGDYRENHRAIVLLQAFIESLND